MLNLIEKSILCVISFIVPIPLPPSFLSKGEKKKLLFPFIQHSPKKKLKTFAFHQIALSQFPASVDGKFYSNIVEKKKVHKEHECYLRKKKLLFFFGISIVSVQFHSLAFHFHSISPFRICQI